jgi:23S rRNA (cytosine1962-C5)-methyltransferase
LGVEAPSPFPVRENGVRFLLSFKEGYSIGLFLDQRDNRRRVLLNHVAAGFPVLPQGLSNARVLNLFAYTCGFSVCAALAGAVVTSVDLSEKHLKWGRHNFAENGLPTEPHEFVRADVFDWMKRSGKKGCAYDVVLVDPPTLSSSKSWGLFRVEKDYPELILHAQGLVKPGGVLWLSANAASLTRKGFLDIAASAVRRGGRRVLQEHFAPQPPDFPVSRDEPPHLKSLWLRLA